MRAIVRTGGLFVALATAALAGCGGVQVAAEAEFPEPLIQPMPVKMGIYYSDEYRKYRHEEERWGVDWGIDLGAYHVKMTNRLFESAFQSTMPVKDPQQGGDGVRAILEPRIEQYSFITPRDTGAKYFAVTIRYRLNVYTPEGQLADSLTFTGYGSARSSGITSTGPMMEATKKAMRDAAAKFLVQFPEQDIARRIVAGGPLIEEKPAEQPAVAADGTQQPAVDAEMEMVPIVDKGAQGAEDSPASDDTPAPVPSPTDTGNPPPEPPATQTGSEEPKGGAGSETPPGEPPSAATNP